MLENFTSNTFTYEKLSKDEMERRGILGRLVGVIADTKNPTRNQRLYSAELWEKVFENPIMKEKIENNCCFGECGHPSDREEVDIEKIAICMDGLPKKNSKGQLMGVFNILDTPCGRILKSLCDYGCNIGISSRGSGDLITGFDGQESVDPDTYNCECWDAVLLPAVKEARLQYVIESLDKTRYKKSLRNRLTESISKEDENNQRIMRESLHNIGIDLDESTNDSYKGVDIIEEGNKFIVTIDDETQAFNSLKNAKSWIDMMKPQLNEERITQWYGINKDGKAVFVAMSKEQVEKYAKNHPEEGIVKATSNSRDIYREDLTVSAGKMDPELLDKAIEEFNANIGDYGDTLTFVKDYFSQYSLNDQKDIARYINQQLSESLINEEQVGREYVDSDKDVKDVVNPEAEDDEEETIVLEGFLAETLNSNEELAMARALDELSLIENPSQEQIAHEVQRACEECSDDMKCDFAAVMSHVLKNIKKPYEEDLTVGDTEVDVDGLQEALHNSMQLEKKMAELQEKLSASYARENTLKEEIGKYKAQIKKLSESSKEIKALTEQLNNANAQISEMEGKQSDSEIKLQESLDNKKKVNLKLTESIKQRDSQIKSLQEELVKTKNERDTKSQTIKKWKVDYHTLSEDYENSQKDLTQLKENYSKKIEQNNQLVEKYQRIAKNAVNKYIDSQAIRLGVSSNEIKNRLPKGYGFNDIDSVCESLQEYKLNVSNLPFNTQVLNEGIGLKATNIRSGLIPENSDDDITDFDLKFASQAMK